MGAEVSNAFSGNNVTNNTLGALPFVGPMIAGGVSENLAGLQGNYAQAQLGQQTADRNLAMQIAAPTDLQIQQMQQANSTNQADLQRRQSLINSSDPALIEAGRQALSLMQGNDTSLSGSAMAPINQQRANQRAQLAAHLQQQLGPGWEQSTAGQQAMQQFDAQTATSLNNARLSTLSSLMGVAQNTSATYGTQANAQENQNIFNMGAAGQNMQLSALRGTPITSAGAQYVGGIMGDSYALGSIGQAQQNAGGTMTTFNNLMGNNKGNSTQGSAGYLPGGSYGDASAMPTGSTMSAGGGAGLGAATTMAA